LRSARDSIGVIAAAAVLVAAAAAAYHWHVHASGLFTHSDFDQVWYAARALAHRGDPYAVVGPGRAFDFKWPLFYPATALVLAMPLAALPLMAARVAFVFLSAFTLVYAVARKRPHAMLLVVSPSAFNALLLAQWSMVMTAAVLVPWLAILVPAKPTVGLAVVAADSKGRALRWAVASGVVVTVIAFTLYPPWVASWFAALRDQHHMTAPILRPGGFMLALAALRWRHWEARVLLAMACVPQTAVSYELLPLYLIPARRGDEV
jgi:hypothetical protein